MQVGDRFSKLEVIYITYRQRRDGTDGAPILVDVRCECGVVRTIRADVLMGKYPQKSCGGKGCRIRGPARPKPVTPKREEWVCKRRGNLDGLI